MTHSLPPKNLILYADDDMDDIRVVKDAFRDYNHAVRLVTFTNGSELLQFCQNLSPFEPLPCLIILDINMPGMDGKQTLKKIRNIDHLAEVPVVLFTTSSLPSEAAFARAYDAGFINKPLDIQQMQWIIDQFIDHCSEEVRKMIRKKNK